MISSGIFGYYIDGAWRKAIQACKDFLEKHPDYELDISFAVLQDDVLETGEKTLIGISPNYAKKSTPAASDYLYINNKKVSAIFFHLPEEPFGYLSNWHESHFDLDGIQYSSAEQYIMYQKCLLFGDDESAKAVLAADDPETQQAIGRDASGFIKFYRNFGTTSE